MRTTSEWLLCSRSVQARRRSTATQLLACKSTPRGCCVHAVPTKRQDVWHVLRITCSRQSSQGHARAAATCKAAARLNLRILPEARVCAIKACRSRVTRRIVNFLRLRLAASRRMTCGASSDFSMSPPRLAANSERSAAEGIPRLIHIKKRASCDRAAERADMVQRVLRRNHKERSAMEATSRRPHLASSIDRAVLCVLGSPRVIRRVSSTSVKSDPDKHELPAGTLYTETQSRRRQQVDGEWISDGTPSRLHRVRLVVLPNPGASSIKVAPASGHAGLTDAASPDWPICVAGRAEVL